jgi:DNA-binding NtrC family response regulator
LALIESLRALDHSLPLVVMTAWGSVELAVRAMRAGAGDFIEKPWDNARLLSVMRNQIALGSSERQRLRLTQENKLLRGLDEPDFVAESRVMQPVLELIKRVAPTQANILILGDNGTGKGLVAGLIHKNSARADASLVKVNMGGIAESVFESEMFGHMRGAFTDAKSDRLGRFEIADGGTLFLDEIGNIPMSQQPKLLRVLEDGEFERLGSSRTLKTDVRLVSATNADLAADVARGAFRKDLLFRLNTVELKLPALKERQEDIVPMARRFLQSFERRYGRADLRLSTNCERKLMTYAWPGNVRELSHVIERAVLMTSGREISELDFSLRESEGAPAENAIEGLTLEQMEERMIKRALERAEGNIQRAADALGVSRPALYRRLEKFGLGEDR